MTYQEAFKFQRFWLRGGHRRHHADYQRRRQLVYGAPHRRTAVLTRARQPWRAADENPSSYTRWSLPSSSCWSSPLYWMFNTSLAPATQLRRFPPVFVQPEPTFAAYAAIFTERPIGIWLRNSAAVAIASTALSMFVSVLAGYSISRIRARGSQAIGLFFLMSRMAAQHPHHHPALRQLPAAAAYRRFEVACPCPRHFYHALRRLDAQGLLRHHPLRTGRRGAD